MLANLYQKIILDKPKFILLILIFLLIISLNFSRDFRLDASTDTLLIDGDPDLKYLNEVNKKYNSREFLVLTYEPYENIISEKSFNNLLSLKYKLQSLDWVHSVVTLLDVPLLNSTDDTLSDKLKNFSTLKSEGINKEKGFQEILNSPVFKNFVISEDGKTTAIIVYLKKFQNIQDLKNKENFKTLKEIKNKQNRKNIIEIRKIINDYESDAKVYLGGIPMIANDMMSQGTHNFTWNASAVPSGAYFIRTQVGSNVENQKITLVK